MPRPKCATSPTATDMPGLLNIPEGLSIALHTCLWIADGAHTFRPSPQIAKELGFSYNHFAKVVQRLVHAGLLETERGPRGGIRLAREPKEVTLLEIYAAAGGAPFRPRHCLLDPSVCRGCACGIGRLLAKENRRLQKTLKQTTLASLARSFDKTRLEIA